MFTNLVIIFLIFLCFWFTAIKRPLLTQAGAIIAIIGGGFIYFAFDYKGLLVIALFFLSSSYWSRYSGHKHIKKIKDVRNSFQVLANGGGAFIASLGYMIHQDTLWIAFFIASLACANADTWASEIGVLSDKKPFSLKKWRYVEPGLSGAITRKGTLAALCGSLVIVLLALSLFNQSFTNIKQAFFLFTCIGFLGCFLDTIIGAFFEVSYKCEKCGQIVEIKEHCGTKTVKNSGLQFIGNNVVNFLASFISGVIGGLFYWH